MAVAGVLFLPPFVCLSAFPHDISKTDATEIAKLQRDMVQFTISPGKPIILASKSQRYRSQVWKTLPSWIFALL